jgi:manganese efflux pump family protein
VLEILLIAGSLGLSNFAASIAIGISCVDRQTHTRGSADDQDPAMSTMPTTRLLVLAAALSIDNLVVGFALGTHHVSVVLSVIAIAAVSVGLSLVGLEFGSRLGTRVERDSEPIGGRVLIGVGIGILVNII